MQYDTCILLIFTCLFSLPETECYVFGLIGRTQWLTRHSLGTEGHSAIWTQIPTKHVLLQHYFVSINQEFTI